MISANSLGATQARRAVLYCDMGRYCTLSYLFYFTWTIVSDECLSVRHPLTCSCILDVSFGKVNRIQDQSTGTSLSAFDLITIT